MLDSAYRTTIHRMRPAFKNTRSNKKKSAVPLGWRVDTAQRKTISKDGKKSMFG